jgi:Tfp pilus assembly protein PilV
MGSWRDLVRRLRDAAPGGGEAGFTLVESLMAAVLLVMVGTSLSGMLASSIVTYKSSRERTLAEQLAMDQIEAIRRMPFSSVGLPNGNPSGTLQATRAIDVTGLHANINLQVSYVDDQTPNAYRTYANYKKVTVTVNRASDSRQLTKEVTFLSAAARNAATESVIQASVIDLGNNTPVVGATVNVATGPSAPRSDLTGANGQAVFPSLTANPATGSQAYYDLSVTPPYGYQMLKDDLSPSTVAHTQLGTAQTWPTTLRAYRPCTVNVSVSTPPSTGSPATSVPYTISIGSQRGSDSFTQGAGASFLGGVGTIAGEPLVPLPSSAGSSQYTAGAYAVSGSGSTAKYWFATGVPKAVPVNYPVDLTQNFTLAGGTWYTATQVSALTVKVQNSSSSLVGGAQVNVSGGPGTAPGIYVTATTAASGSSKGMVTIYVPSGSGYTITAWGPTTSSQLTAQSVTTTTTKTLTVT